MDDLKLRLGKILIAFSKDRKPIYARQIKAHGAMTALLKDAFKPNLVQTIYETPVIIHGGPFANIAHGCNSVMATRTGQKLADFVVTEAGFGADLGAEKFMDIKSRTLGATPDAVVIVATIRALKYHGGVLKDKLNKENLDALRRGFENLQRHIQNCLNQFGMNVVVAVNRFKFDSDQEISLLRQLIESENVSMHLCEHWEKGAIGATHLAKDIVKLCQKQNKAHALYGLNQPILSKIETIAKNIYKAKAIKLSALARKKLKEFERLGGVKRMPVCIAKTPYSFSSDPAQLGATVNHILEIKDFDLKNGAGFIVVICGPIMTMPGLPVKPAAETIDVNSKGILKGLF